jgi:hypothetical protein
MKTLQDICVSLDMAKKLKETGYPQEESLFHWLAKGEHVLIKYFEYLVIQKEYANMLFAAPTTDELLERLPHCVSFDFYFEFLKRQPYYMVSYISARQQKNLHSEQSSIKDPTNCLAQMWLWLKENNLLNNKK